MSDTAAPPLPPAAPAQQARRGFSVRTYVLAGCSVGGALCATLAANTEINYVFAIASAAFGGGIVLLTAAPAAVPAPVVVAAAPTTIQPAATTPTVAAASSGGMNSIGIGITAGILSFIMNQIAQVAVGMGVFNIVGTEMTADQLLFVTSMIGLMVVAVKTPFDLLVGAFHLSRARNVIVALGLFVVTYLLCYFIEQAISATMGASGLFNVASVYGGEALLWGLVYVIVVPTVAQGVGAFGARLAGWLTRRVI
jgi:hypothetical protein